MEIRFEISTMYLPTGFDPREGARSVLEKAAGHLSEHLAHVKITDVDKEDEDLYHVTLVGPEWNLFPVFTNLYRWFAWKNLENPVLGGRFSRIIL